MIKVSVLYPNRPGAGCYCGTHMARLRECLGEACLGKDLSAITPGTPAPLVSAGHLFFASVEAFQQSFAPHATRIMANLANVTDAEPLVRISHVCLDA
jgi:uncharacterized protein (TIGR02118 family)